MAVAADTGADADGRHLQALADFRSKLGRHLLQHDAEAADFLEQLRIGLEFIGLGLFLGPDGVGAKLVDALRRQAEVAHDGNAGREDAFDALADFGAAFELDGVGAALLHDADGALQRFQRIALVRAEGEVDHDEGLLGRPHHALCMVDHLVQRDRQGGLVAGHHVGGAVADEDDVDPGPVNDAGHGVIVRGEHGDFLAVVLHFLEHLRGDALRGGVNGHGCKLR